MSLKFYPDQGAILICDFKGFVEPEMTKRRPVIVVSPKRKNGPRSCMIVPLSTTAPRPVEKFHLRIDLVNPLPDPYPETICWVKCDMLYQVSFERLSLPFIGKEADGTRMYDQRVVDHEELQKIRHAIGLSLGLHN